MCSLPVPDALMHPYRPDRKNQVCELSTDVFFSKKNFEISISLTTKQFFFTMSHSISKELWPQEDDSIFTCVCGWYSELCSQ